MGAHFTCQNTCALSLFGLGLPAVRMRAGHLRRTSHWTPTISCYAAREQAPGAQQPRAGRSTTRSKRPD
jgi:hypothetical protein